MLPGLRRFLLAALLPLVLLGCPEGGEVDPGPDAGRADAGASTRDGGAADAGSHDLPDGSQQPEDWCAKVGPSRAALDNYAAVLQCLRGADAEGVRRAAVDRFVAAVENGDGFPIVAPGQVVFVYVASERWDAEDDANDGEDFSPARRAAPLRVAGDFSDWSADAATLESEGLDFHHLSLNLTVGADRWRYKFLARDAAGAEVWFSDPLSRRHDYDPNGRISIVRGGAAQGHLEWIRGAHATLLNNDRTIYLYVPPGYDGAPQERYPVLYLHDGNNAFDVAQPWSAPNSWEADQVAETEIGAGRARPFLLVAVPNNADRMDEYTHCEDRLGGEVTGGSGDGYADFLVNDLKPLVDGRYRTRPGREDTALLGSSLGGLVSYYVGLRHPEVFRYVGGMSSTFTWGTFGLSNPTVIDLYREVADLPGRAQVYYLDSGGEPPPGGVCLHDGNDDDSDNFCATIEMKRLLEAQGISTYPLDGDAEVYAPEDIDIMHWWAPGHGHHEAAWNERLHRPVRLFFRP